MKLLDLCLFIRVETTHSQQGKGYVVCVAEQILHSVVVDVITVDCFIFKKGCGHGDG